MRVNPGALLLSIGAVWWITWLIAGFCLWREGVHLGRAQPGHGEFELHMGRAARWCNRSTFLMRACTFGWFKR